MREVVMVTLLQAYLIHGVGYRLRPTRDGVRINLPTDAAKAVNTDIDGHNRGEVGRRD